VKAKFDAKAVLGWLKKRWMIVLFCVLAVVPPAVAFVFSSGWNKSIREGQEKVAADAKSKLDRAKVTYALPSPSPEFAPEPLSAEPNAVLTAFFKEKRDAIVADSTKVVDRALRHQGARKPLLDDLFPRPKNASDRIARTVEFAKAMVGEPDRGRPGVYQKLLAELNAGGPADTGMLASELDDEMKRQVEQIKGANQTRQLTEAEADTVRKDLLQRRIGRYQQRAGEISVYASMSSFSRRVPRQVPPQPPSIAMCFAWQADYWAISDVLDAVKKANTPVGASRPSSVDRSVVKRINSVGFTSPLVPFAERAEGGGPALALPSAGNPNDPNAPAPAPATPGNDGTGELLKPNFGYTVTGRIGGGADATNGMYDITYMNLNVVVSSERLPELIDAIASSNFMTVVDLDLTEVDLWKDLDEGFYYGSDHVVQAKLEIELIWLRNWTTQFMPKPIKRLLNVPIPPPPEPTPNPDGTPPPPPGPDPEEEGLIAAPADGGSGMPIPTSRDERDRR
jgi:hypothetical protein